MAIGEAFREVGRQTITDGREALNTYERGARTERRLLILVATLEELGFFSLKEFLDAEESQIYG